MALLGLITLGSAPLLEPCCICADGKGLTISNGDEPEVNAVYAGDCLSSPPEDVPLVACMTTGKLPINYLWQLGNIGWIRRGQAIDKMQRRYKSFFLEPMSRAVPVFKLATNCVLLYHTDRIIIQ